MKCDFDSTGTLGFLRDASIITAIFSCIICFGFISSKSTFVIITAFIVLMISLVSAAVTSSLCSGCILACKKQLIIYHNFLFRKVLVTRTDYKDIDHSDYKIESLRDRINFVCYLFVLVIHLKNGKQITLSSRLDIPEKLPTENPDEYKECINKLPLMKLCRLINKKVRSC